MLAYQGVLLTRSTSQTISNDTETTISWSAEKHDVGAYHESAQPTWILVPTDLGGTYNIYASINWEAHAVGYRWIKILVNDVVITENIRSTYATYEMTQFVSVPWLLAEGDIVTIKVYQASGGNLDIVRYDAYTPLFGIDLMGNIEI